MKISEKDFLELRIAVDILENPGIAARLSNYIGRPFEKSFDTLPEKWSNYIMKATKAALKKALDCAVFTIKDGPAKYPANIAHKMLAGLSGAVGGAFGLIALSLELPVSTTIMLRSIADIAKSEDEDISLIETKLACLEVFALGGASTSDDSAESGYLVIRSLMASYISQAAKYMAKGVLDEGAPVILKLIAIIASRFSVPVTQKFAAQLVPAVGAIGGASINLIFIEHFQDVARGHFMVRRLEKIYGRQLIQDEYEKIRRNGGL